LQSLADPSYYSKKRHTLLIRNVRDSDFGEYECKAVNSLGMSSGFVTLTGKPYRPTFENKTHQMTPRSKIFDWQTESWSPISDYKFRFRHVRTGNENFRKNSHFMWNELTIPADSDSTGPFHTKSYKLDGLAPSTVYEVMITSRNKYGSSESSNIMRFATPSEGECRASVA